MRIRHLNLIRYGRFNDASLDLPAADHDFHLVFGQNEAGKSTAQAAIEDLLFDIPHTSQYAFLHGGPNMRIGAVLENDGTSLEMLRRKGRKDTVRDSEDNPSTANEKMLAAFLSGADRDFFERMFSLSQERLRTGGREILEARNEVGQMLFSAGSGIAGLREKLSALDEEADGLWSSRRATHRKFYRIHDRLKEADDAVRAHVVTAKKWKELKRSFESAREISDDLQREIQEKTVERRKLTRIRRVFRNVHSLAQIEEQIDGLVGVALLPEDARATFDDAEKLKTINMIQLEDLAARVEEAVSERDSLKIDEALLQRGDDVSALADRRIKVRDGNADLPKLRVKLLAAESELRQLAVEIEWGDADTDQLLARIPSRTKVSAVRGLLTQRGELSSAVKNAEAAVVEVNEKIEELDRQLNGQERPVDVTRLAAAIEALKGSSDIDARVAAAEKEKTDLHASVNQRIGSLRPAVADEATLVTMTAPPRDTVLRHRDALRDLENRVRTCAESTRTAEQLIARQRKARDRVIRDEDAVSSQDIHSVRQRRDAGWSLIKRRYVVGENVDEADVVDFAGEGGNLIESYEESVGEADSEADRRFVKAEAAAQLAVLDRQIAEEEDKLESLKTDQEALSEEEQALEKVWRDMWSHVSFDPLSPDAMLEWMSERDDILDQMESRSAAERQVSSLRDEESRLKTLLIGALEGVGLDAETMRSDPLRLLLEQATTVQRRNEKLAETIAQLSEALEQAKAEARRKLAGQKRAQEEWSRWEEKWKAALSELELSPEAEPDVVSTQVDGIERMREFAVQIREINQERIAKIERDSDTFDEDVEKLVRAIAQDLTERDAEDAVIEMKSRVERVEQDLETKERKETEIAELEQRLEEGKESQREARAALSHLVQTAGVESVDDLEAAITKSETLRRLSVERESVRDVLSQEGDGLTLAELTDECRDVDLDEAAAKEHSLEQSLEDLQERVRAAQSDLSAAREAFDSVGGGDATARATAARQGALAEMQEVAESYVRVRTSALLLRWAIDRFRLEKQAPLLRRAGELFSTLTDGGFSELRVEFDDKDNTSLSGVRSDGSTVPTAGLSTGTADQLYLALRVASVEDYLERAEPLPFVADDLFIHFDDDRAAAGFKVLAELSKKTQVLFFTHHQHLLEIASSALPESPSVLRLETAGPTGAV